MCDQSVQPSAGFCLFSFLPLWTRCLYPALTSEFHRFPWGRDATEAKAKQRDGERTEERRVVSIILCKKTPFEGFFQTSGVGIWPHWAPVWRGPQCTTNYQLHQWSQNKRIRPASTFGPAPWTIPETHYVVFFQSGLANPRLGGDLVFIYFINSVIYFLTSFSVKIPQTVINIWLCGFLENNKCLHLGTLWSSHFFCYTLTPIREGESDVALTGKVWGPLSYTLTDSIAPSHDGGQYQRTHYPETIAPYRDNLCGIVFG